MRSILVGFLFWGLLIFNSTTAMGAFGWSLGYQTYKVDTDKFRDLYVTNGFTSPEFSPGAWEVAFLWQWDTGFRVGAAFDWMMPKEDAQGRNVITYNNSISSAVVGYNIFPGVFQVVPEFRLGWGRAELEAFSQVQDFSIENHHYVFQPGIGFEVRFNEWLQLGARASYLFFRQEYQKSKGDQVTVDLLPKDGFNAVISLQMGNL
ncbi:MAG: hypothetical protein IT289_12245 [Oligoflexia bacterium]|nr:hypothetical protein [Oligoflexia bacterium]